MVLYCNIQYNVTKRDVPLPRSCRNQYLCYTLMLWSNSICTYGWEYMRLGSESPWINEYITLIKYLCVWILLRGKSWMAHKQFYYAVKLDLYCVWYTIVYSSAWLFLEISADFAICVQILYGCHPGADTGFHHGGGGGFTLPSPPPLPFSPSPLLSLPSSLPIPPIPIPSLSPPLPPLPLPLPLPWKRGVRGSYSRKFWNSTSL